MCCDKARADISLVVTINGEMDSFGPVSMIGVCQECLDAERARKQVEGEEPWTCPNCGRLLQLKDRRTWKWYDFYAEQGDEALVLCKVCQQEPAHQARMARDRREEAEEQRSYEARAYRSEG